MPKVKSPPASPALVEVHTRLFAEDVATVQRIAREKQIPWQIELRLILRQALKGRDLPILGER